MNSQEKMNGQANNLGIWEIAVLALLRQCPMHPYLMQRLLRAHHKDEILALKRGSLYHAIGRLVRAELIAVAATGRKGRRPERTTYRLTPAGRSELVRALRQIISVPRHESSDFMAAMSFLVHLTPADAIPRLDERCEHLEKEMLERQTLVKAVSARIPRIHLVESEYLLAMMQAELAWTRGLAADLRSGKLTWDVRQILREARAAAKSAGSREE
jgi:DNA-binding PadR family transcriptional regulator